MKIKTEVLDDGAVICEADCNTRHYRSRYRGYTEAEAKKRFTRRVLKAEQEALDKVRMEALLMCLNCSLPEKQCKGRCVYKPKNGRSLPRGKGVNI